MGKSPYPKEFRDDVVAIARKREISIRQIARDFNISEPTIYEWIKKADEAEGNTSASSVDSASEAEVRALKNRNRQLEQELEVLRRATAYFSQALLPK
jgi:transposase